MVGTAPENLNKLEPGLHLEKKYVSKAVEAVKHANWFEIEASDNTIRTLVRIIKDLKARYKGMDALSPWMIDLICHHAVLSNPLGESLSLPKAFRRLIQVLAGGIFLPGSGNVSKIIAKHIFSWAYRPLRFWAISNPYDIIS